MTYKIVWLHFDPKNDDLFKEVILCYAKIF